MERKISKARNVLTKIRALKPGDTVSFPIEWMDTVRAQSSKCNAIYGGRRATSVDSDKRLIHVERLA